jgi:hypothetical protein
MERSILVDREVTHPMRPRKRDSDPIDVPDELRTAFERVRLQGGRLGDMAEVFQGLMPRRETFRRMARPGPGWGAALTADCIQPFSVAAPEVFVRMDRAALMRFPSPEEYDHPEKVVIRRVAPPVVAAVDTGRHLVMGDVYSIVPAHGLLCGYLACVLNSRVTDFYLNRIRPLEGAPSGGYLRPVDLEAIPVIVPPLEEQRPFAARARELATLPDSRSFYHTHTRRTMLLAEINHGIFALYGIGQAEIQRLAKMHF